MEPSHHQGKLIPIYILYSVYSPQSTVLYKVSSTKTDNCFMTFVIKRRMKLIEPDSDIMYVQHTIII